ncbi:MAG: M42 family metallopeptidase [Anaerolineales bacterium]
MKNLLKKLTETFSPSGYEGAIRELIRAEVAPLADEIRVDALGNLIVRKGKGGKKIMVAAHMDEIGLIATHIDQKGFVRFTGIGGVYPRNLPGGRVRFVNGTPGVISIEPAEKMTESQPLEKCYVDVGAVSAENHPIKIGDVAGFERPFLDLGARWVAKSMDDRIGCLVAIETLRALKSTPNEVYFVFTTQEEVGTRGAETSAFGIDPDLGFSLDVTGWGDTPGQKYFEMALGKGPAIKIKDGGMLSDPRIVNWMVTTAEKNGLPYQREVLLGGTTDARAMQLVRAGVPVGCISIPCRYVHSPSEMVDASDVENAVKLAAALLANPVDL